MHCQWKQPQLEDQNLQEAVVSFVKVHPSLNQGLFSLIYPDITNQEVGRSQAPSTAAKSQTGSQHLGPMETNYDFWDPWDPPNTQLSLTNFHA
jgi:hypothetical protein